MLTDLAPSMASEDFSYMLEEKPGAYIRIGNGPAEDGHNLHSPRYDFNDEVRLHLKSRSGAMFGLTLTPHAIHEGPTAERGHSLRASHRARRRCRPLRPLIPDKPTLHSAARTLATHQRTMSYSFTATFAPVMFVLCRLISW